MSKKKAKKAAKKTATAIDWEHSLYVLAEFLHMPVYRIKQEMPLSEFIGWCRYGETKGKQQEVNSVTNILKGFGIGH